MSADSKCFYKRSPGQGGWTGASSSVGGEPVMGEGNPSQRLLYSRCVIRATPAIFASGPFCRPGPATLYQFPSEWDSREEFCDGGTVRTEGKPGQDSPGFLFGTLPNELWLGWKRGRAFQPPPLPKVLPRPSHAPQARCILAPGFSFDGVMRPPAWSWSRSWGLRPWYHAASLAKLGPGLKAVGKMQDCFVGFSSNPRLGHRGHSGGGFGQTLGFRAQRRAWAHGILRVLRLSLVCGRRY